MLLLNNDCTLKINTAPMGEEADWAVICEGFDKIGKTLSESVFRGAFLGDGGFAATHITGGQLILTLSGARVCGDKAQDYIFSNEVKHCSGGMRGTDFLLEESGKKAVTGKVTLAKIRENGGDSNAPAAVSVEIHFNGKVVDI